MRIKNVSIPGLSTLSMKDVLPQGGWKHERLPSLTPWLPFILLPHCGSDTCSAVTLSLQSSVTLGFSGFELAPSHTS